MKIENEEDLDNFVICRRCHTLHKVLPLHDGFKACCSECGALLYRFDSRLVEHGLAWSVTALLFFFVANFFPIVQIEVLGNTQFVTIPMMLEALFEQEFYIVGFVCLFIVFLFPLGTFVIYGVLFLLLFFQKGERSIGKLLVLLSHLKPWNMVDIFLVSILVSLVKLIGYAQIHIGTSFWALVLFVLVDIYINKTLHLSEIWILQKVRFKKEIE